MWSDWEDSDFDNPTGDETLGGRLAQFIIEQVPESRIPVLFRYSNAEWDDSLIYFLLGIVFDYEVTLTPQFLSEIREFAANYPGDYADATLNLLEEYSRSHNRAAVPA